MITTRSYAHTLLPRRRDATFKRRRHRFAKSTADTYLQQIRDYLTPECGGLGSLLLEEVDYGQLDAFAARLAAWPRLDQKGKPRPPLAPSSQNAVLELAREILADAGRRGLWQHQIDWQQILQPERKRVVPEISDAYLTRVVASLPQGGDYRSLVGVLALNGLRISEALGLTAFQLDFERGLVRVRWQKLRRQAGNGPTKTETGVRKVEMNEALPLWRSLAAAHPHGPLFLGSRGAPIDPDNFRARQWTTAKSALAETTGDAEIREWRIHDLRHRFADDAIARGASREWLQAQLGHTADYVTRRYLHQGAVIRPSLPGLAGEALLGG